MSIPEKEVFQFCPRCGEKLPEIGISPLRCRACSFTHYFSPKPGAKAIVITPSGKLLLTRRNIPPFIGKLDLVGGFVESLENFEEGVLRELHEEIGYLPQIKKISYYSSFAKPYVFHDIVHSTIVPVFLVETLEEIPTDRFDKNEIQEVLLVSPAEIDMEDIGTEDQRRFLTDFINTLS